VTAQEQELELFLAAEAQKATERRMLEIMADADKTILAKYVNMIIVLANAQVHDEAQVRLLVTVVGEEGRLLCAEAPLLSQDEVLREALETQAQKHSVDLNLFPGASGRCRVHHDKERDRGIVSDLALVRGPQGKGGKKLSHAPLLKALMTASGDTVDNGEYRLRILFLDIVEMSNPYTGFADLGGLALGTPFHVPGPWALDPPEDPEHREFRHFDRFTLARYCSTLRECSRGPPPDFNLMSLLAGQTRNLGVAPPNGRMVLGKGRVAVFCRSCSGIKSVGKCRNVQCCCGGSEQTVAKEKARGTNDKKVQKMRKELSFQNAGAKWQMREQSTPGQCSSTASRDFYKDSSDDSEDGYLSLQEGEKDDEDDDAEEDDEDDAAGDDEEAEDGESDGALVP
jgi:hypothetical protein